VSRTTQEPACPSTSQNTLVSSVNWELFTNGVHASQGLTASRYNGHWAPGTPPVRLWLQSDGNQVLIQVWDASDRVPEAQVEKLDAENGRGLLLVTYLSADWNIHTPQRSSGKIVWAAVAANNILATKTIES
jgi:hypothetical protein